MAIDKGPDSIKSNSGPLQWHPAFFATLQIELENEKEKLIFENEHTLSTKPMLIDVVIRKGGRTVGSGRVATVIE